MCSREANATPNDHVLRSMPKTNFPFWITFWITAIACPSSGLVHGDARSPDANCVGILPPLFGGARFLPAVVNDLGLYGDRRLDGDVHEHKAVEGHPIGGGVHYSFIDAPPLR